MESNVGTTPPQNAQSLVERAQTQASSRINEAKSDAAQTLNTLASTLHQSGSQLRSEQKNMAGDYLDRAAEGIEKVASYLQNTDAGEVVDNIESFARRRPELFIGSAFAVGLLAARFLKSSSRSTALVPMPAGTTAGITDREVPTSISYEGTSAPVGDRTTESQP